MTKVAEELVKQLRRAESHERLEIVFEVLQALADNGKVPFGLGEKGGLDIGTGLSSEFQVCHGILITEPATLSGDISPKKFKILAQKTFEHMTPQRKEGESTTALHFSRSTRQQAQTYSPWWVRGKQQHR